MAAEQRALFSEEQSSRLWWALEWKCNTIEYAIWELHLKIRTNWMAKYTIDLHYSDGVRFKRVFCRGAYPILKLLTVSHACRFFKLFPRNSLRWNCWRKAHHNHSQWYFHLVEFELEFESSRTHKHKERQHTTMSSSTQIPRTYACRCNFMANSADMCLVCVTRVDYSSQQRKSMWCNAGLLQWCGMVCSDKVEPYNPNKEANV